MSWQMCWEPLKAFLLHKKVSNAMCAASFPCQLHGLYLLTKCVKAGACVQTAVSFDRGSQPTEDVCVSAVDLKLCNSMCHSMLTVLFRPQFIRVVYIVHFTLHFVT